MPGNQLYQKVVASRDLVAAEHLRSLESISGGRPDEAERVAYGHVADTRKRYEQAYSVRLEDYY